MKLFVIAVVMEVNLWSGFSFNEPLTGEPVTQINGVALPSDYIEFMCRHNGGEGDVADAAWVILFPMEELQEINDDYEVDQYLPDCCIIGSNGSGELYGVDRDGNYFMIPVIFDRNDMVGSGRTLEEFILSLKEYYDNWT